MPKTLDLDELTSFCDYIIPPHALRGNRRLQVHIADRHLENFFRTIHIFLPMLDKSRFKQKYNSLRKDFGDKRLVFATTEDPNRPQFVCLLYAILALGALYEDDQDDSSMWASWYFAEAQNMLGRLLDASNLELTQAATFLGAYAQHAIKPNLAYNLNGIAARLAYSIGLTVESMHGSLGFDKEEAKRTWAIIYIQEVELSLDAGRPMSIRSSDMNMNYPTVQLPATDQSRTDAAQVVFITHLANISKIVKSILKLSGVHEERPILLLEERESLRQQLDRWHDSLPNYLSIENSSPAENSGDNDEASFLHDWRARQQSSLRIRKWNIVLCYIFSNSKGQKLTTSRLQPGHHHVTAQLTTHTERDRPRCFQLSADGSAPQGMHERCTGHDHTHPSIFRDSSRPQEMELLLLLLSPSYVGSVATDRRQHGLGRLDVSACRRSLRADQAQSVTTVCRGCATVSPATRRTPTKETEAG